jgi:two-component system catabolic regulation response regulator CreB
MKEKILIVEDESAIADTISYALTTEGYHPICVTTGEAAIDKFSGEELSLVILDIGLPDISGFEIIKELRKVSEVPVLFLTARSEEIDRILGLELGADDYVVKPFSPRELAARVKAILRRTNRAPKYLPKDSVRGEEKSEIFEVDDNKRQIKYFKHALTLARYEYEILKLFIRRPGWVFSREKIMELVWVEPEESFDRTVDAHIKTIRAKLREVNPELDPIETHRGVGYALKEKLL